MSPEGSTVTIDEAVKPLLARRAPARRIQAFALELQETVARGRPFGCLITSNEDMQRLNAQFRRKNKPTDVLSFPSGEKRGFLGDIAISAELAAEQASELGHPVDKEIAILMLHGLLHLLGLDHEKDDGRMARAEKRWRARLELPAGLIERVRGR